MSRGAGAQSSDRLWVRFPLEVIFSFFRSGIEATHGVEFNTQYLQNSPGRKKGSGELRVYIFSAYPAICENRIKPNELLSLHQSVISKYTVVAI